MLNQIQYIIMVDLTYIRVKIWIDWWYFLSSCVLYSGGFLQTEPMIRPELTNVADHHRIYWEKCILENSITQFRVLCKALQKNIRQNSCRGFPPKENSNKTELTWLSCVHYFMHTGCAELVQSKVYLNKDLNEHNEWCVQGVWLF